MLHCASGKGCAHRINASAASSPEVHAWPAERSPSHSQRASCPFSRAEQAVSTVRKCVLEPLYRPVPPLCIAARGPAESARLALGFDFCSRVTRHPILGRGRQWLELVEMEAFPDADAARNKAAVEKMAFLPECDRQSVRGGILTPDQQRETFCRQNSNFGATERHSVCARSNGPAVRDDKRLGATLAAREFA